MSETLVSVRPSPVHAVRWPAVLAGMAVGIALHLVLALAGAALGYALYESGRPIEPMPVRAAAWNLGAMLAAALIGGYVAARASGLRRLADGVLHGAVSWGATTVLFAVLTTTAFGGMLGGLFGLVIPQARTATAAGSALAQATAVASGWLAAAIALSLVAGMVGGGIGARGARRLLKGPRFTVEAPATRPGGYAEPAR